MVGLWHNEAVTMRTKRYEWSGESSSHPFIARIPLTGSLLLPLLIALLLCLLLGTAPSPVVALFLIHLPLVRGGVIDVWPARVSRRGRMFIRQGSHYRWGICRRRRRRRRDGCGSCRSQGRTERGRWRRRRGCEWQLTSQLVCVPGRRFT